MEFESPIKEGPITYTIPIRTSVYMDVKYISVVSDSYTTPPSDLFEFTSYIANIASLYEEYSKKWFNREILSIFFIKNLAYDWNYMSYKSHINPPKYESVPIEIHQIWCPVKITVELNKFTIFWHLINNDYKKSSPEDVSTKKSEEVPYSKNQIMIVLKKTPRSEYHRKIRKARLAVVATQLRLNELLLSYVEKYGEINDASDTESVLSFDFEDKNYSGSSLSP